MTINIQEMMERKRHVLHLTIIYHRIKKASYFKVRGPFQIVTTLDSLYFEKQVMTHHRTI